jgi:hypothetical protein
MILKMSVFKQWTFLKIFPVLAKSRFPKIKTREQREMKYYKHGDRNSKRKTTM